jgi:hypothetical protein
MSLTATGRERARLELSTTLNLLATSEHGPGATHFELPCVLSSHYDDIIVMALDDIAVFIHLRPVTRANVSAGWLVRNPDHMFICGPVPRAQIETKFRRLIRISADTQKGCFDRPVDDKRQTVVSANSQTIGKIMACAVGLIDLENISISPLDSDFSAFNWMSAGISHGSLKGSPRIPIRSKPTTINNTR